MKENTQGLNCKKTEKMIMKKIIERMRTKTRYKIK
jgi:hypothetical protein